MKELDTVLAGLRRSLGSRHIKGTGASLEFSFSGSKFPERRLIHHFDDQLYDYNNSSALYISTTV